MLERGRLGLVFGSSGVGLQPLPREVRTLAAIGLAGKCVSDLSVPAFSGASGLDWTVPMGAWLAVEGVKPARLEAEKSGSRVSRLK